MPYSDPKYPIVNPSPSVDDCFNAIRVRDIAVALGITSASWSYGYIFGKPARMPTASTAAAIGFTFASFVIFQDTRGRLMGYSENKREVEKYGIAPAAAAAAAANVDGGGSRRFPIGSSSGLMSQGVKPVPAFKNYD